TATTRVRSATAFTCALTRASIALSASALRSGTALRLETTAMGSNFIPSTDVVRTRYIEFNDSVVPTPEWLKTTRDEVEGAAFDRWIEQRIRRGVAAELMRLATGESVKVRYLDSGLVGRALSDMTLVLRAQEL